MLGHKRPSMTLRYAHVGDRETEVAAERIGEAIERALEGRSVQFKRLTRRARTRVGNALQKPVLGVPRAWRGRHVGGALPT